MELKSRLQSLNGEMFGSEAEYHIPTELTKLNLEPGTVATCNQDGYAAQP